MTKAKSYMVYDDGRVKAADPNRETHGDLQIAVHLLGAVGYAIRWADEPVETVVYADFGTYRYEGGRWSADLGRDGLCRLSPEKDAARLMWLNKVRNACAPPAAGE